MWKRPKPCNALHRIRPPSPSYRKKWKSISANSCRRARSVYLWTVTRVLRAKSSLLSHANQKRQVNDSWMSFGSIAIYLAKLSQLYGPKTLLTHVARICQNLFIGVRIAYARRHCTTWKMNWIALRGKLCSWHTLLFMCWLAGASSSSTRIEAEGMENSGLWRIRRATSSSIM